MARPAASPWAVLVSEVMLQQTPVVRVLPVFTEWLQRWPDAGRPGRGLPGGRDQGLGPAGLPAPGPAAARRRHRDHRRARRRSSRTPSRTCCGCPASASTPPGPSPPSPSAPEPRWWTPTSAGCCPGWSAAWTNRGSRPPPPTARRWPPCCRDEPGQGRPVLRRGDGARRPGLFGPLPRLRVVPAGRPLPVAAGRLRRGRGQAGGADLARHRSAGSRPDHGGAAAQRAAGGGGHPRDDDGRERTAAPVYRVTRPTVWRSACRRATWHSPISRTRRSLR